MSTAYRAPVPMRLPSNDPQRLASLQGQERRAPAPSPALQSVLGGTRIAPGREQEAIAIWESLRGRARGGDVVASEDLVMLTRLLADDRTAPEKAHELRTLTEGALEVVTLPRHRQEQLGRLVRLAVQESDRAAAHTRLEAMTIDPPDIESDSAHRIAAAAVATLEGDADAVLALVGRLEDEVPLDDALDPLATVLRANALELRDEVDAAVEALRTLPHRSVLDGVRSSFPSLALCARSAAVLDATRKSAAIQRGAWGALGVGVVLGVVFLLIGLVMIGVLLVVGGPESVAETVFLWILALFMTLLGSVFLLFGIHDAQRTAFLRAHGLSLVARVLETTATGARVGHVPIYRLRILVAGPGGPYEASVDKMLHADEVSTIVGRSLGVRVHPERPGDLMLDE